MICLGAQMVKDRLSPDSAGVGFGSIHSSNFPLQAGSLREELHWNSASNMGKLVIHLRGWRLIHDSPQPSLLGICKRGLSQGAAWPLYSVCEMISVRDEL